MPPPPVFSSLRRRGSPLAGAFFIPSSLSGRSLLSALFTSSLPSSSSSSSSPFFQLRNHRILTRRLHVLSLLFDSLLQDLSFPPLPPSAATCFREFYIVIHRCNSLLDYCSQSSRLWLLIQNPQLSGHFHDLAQEISTLLDVLPLDSLRLASDVIEQIELLRSQIRRAGIYIDPDDEMLRLRVFSFLDEFEKGRAPDPADLRVAFVDRLGLRSAVGFRREIEFLEEQIHSQEEDASADPSLLGGVVAVTRYARFRLFGFGGEAERLDLGDGRLMKTPALARGSGDLWSSSSSSSITVPKDFCCPISLDLMKDPVITSTGQTYDRASITQWMDEGHASCPNSGQILTHARLVPNLALRSLISQWCAVHGIPYDPPNGSDASAEAMAMASAGKAAVEANCATAEILVGALEKGCEVAKAVAARELRFLAKTGRENRARIAEAGAIPLLQKLLCSSNAVAQENSVTAILNLSIHDKNKSRVMEEEGCLRSIVGVLRHGLTSEARENAAAALFSLSAVHGYKKRIADESGAVDALAEMLRDGSPRGRKDAVAALFNLSTHAECCGTMVESGAVSALVGALEMEGVAEDAAGVLAWLVRRPVAAKAIAGEETAVTSLVGLMRRGSSRGKENAVVALHELCRSGGLALTQKVARTPALGGLIQTLLFTGTKRARRKAASLARMCQRCDAAADMPFAGGWAMEYALARSNSMRRGSSFVGGDVSVPVPVAISVPVL